MENIKEIEIENVAGELVKHIIIDKGDGEFTSMTKDHYEAQQAEQSTPSVTNGD